MKFLLRKIAFVVLLVCAFVFIAQVSFAQNNLPADNEVVQKKKTNTIIKQSVRANSTLKSTNVVAQPKIYALDAEGNKVIVVAEKTINTQGISANANEEEIPLQQKKPCVIKSVRLEKADK